MPSSIVCCGMNFYPRPPGGGRRRDVSVIHHAVIISIHALRVEGDLRLRFSAVLGLQFLSTPSGWRATIEWCDALAATKISIHALRVEGDLSLQRVQVSIDISIHALRVEGDRIGLPSSSTT